MIGPTTKPTKRSIAGPEPAADDVAEKTSPQRASRAMRDDDAGEHERHDRQRRARDDLERRSGRCVDGDGGHGQSLRRRAGLLSRRASLRSDPPREAPARRLRARRGAGSPSRATTGRDIARRASRSDRVFDGTSASEEPCAQECLCRTSQTASAGCGRATLACARALRRRRRAHPPRATRRRSLRRRRASSERRGRSRSMGDASRPPARTTARDRRSANARCIAVTTIRA